MNSPQKKKTLEFLKNIGKIDDSYLIKEREKKDKIIKRVQDIEKELGKNIEEFNKICE